MFTLIKDILYINSMIFRYLFALVLNLVHLNPLNFRYNYLIIFYLSKNIFKFIKYIKYILLSYNIIYIYIYILHY